MCESSGICVDKIPERIIEGSVQNWRRNVRKLYVLHDTNYVVLPNGYWVYWPEREYKNARNYLVPR